MTQYGCFVVICLPFSTTLNTKKAFTHKIYFHCPFLQTSCLLRVWISSLPLFPSSFVIALGASGLLLGLKLYAFLSFAGRRATELMGSAAPRLGGGRSLLASSGGDWLCWEL